MIRAGTPAALIGVMETTTNRKPKGTPTRLNLAVLRDSFGGATTIANKIDAATAPHLRRCMAAGLVTATRETLSLTEAGVAAIGGAS